MKYKALTMNRVLFFLVFFAFSAFGSAMNTSAVTGLHAAKLPPPPPPMALSYGGPICANGSAFIPTITNFTTGGTFIASSGLLNINPQTGVITGSLSQPGTYLVTYLYNVPPGPFQQAQTQVVIQPVPAISVTGSGSVCAGGSIVLTATGAGPYQWSTGMTGPQINITPAGNTTIVVSSTNGFGCTGSKSHVITYKTVPFVFVSSASVCAGSSVTLVAYATPSDNATYTWTPGPVVGSGATVVVSPVVTQIYTIYANVGGCVGNTSQIVNVVPTVTSNTNFSYIYPLCTNSGNPLPILTTGFVTGGVFYSDDPEVKVNPVTGQVNLANITAGQHSVSYSIAARGCTLQAETNAAFLINQGGSLSTDFSEITIEEGTSIDIGVTGGSAYSWTPPDYLSCADCDRPTATPPVTTRYCVSDVVDGCITRACTDVNVVCVNNGEFAVPNAFTPNGDNNNEKFCLKGWSYCVTDFKVMIFDRWGEKVFEDTEPDFCWDGTHNGKLLNSGVYIYAISASINRNPISVKKGNITLIR